MSTQTKIKKKKELKESSGQALTSKAQRYLQDHYTDKFSLDELADALFVNKSYLARTFRKTTGMTLLQYHNQLRCDEAARLLSDPHLTISGVAFRSGFNSASHFSRIFKLYRGCTPSEYRRRL